MYISGCESALVILALFRIINAHSTFTTIGNKLQLVPRNEIPPIQIIGLKPANCVLENANWCGIELDSYSTRDGCFNASTACWKQNSDCFNSAGPTGSKNCNIWTAKCQRIQEACNAGNYQGPPDAGRDLTPTLPLLSVPPPKSSAPASSALPVAANSTFFAFTSTDAAAPSTSSGPQSLRTTSSLTTTTSPPSSRLYSSISSSVSGTAAPLTSGKSSSSADPSSSSILGPHLNVTAFFQRNCVVPVNGDNSVVVPAGRCSQFGNNTSPNDPIANPIPNGYVSCCYYFDGSFSSLHILNSDLQAYNGCSITKFNGYDCDYGGNPETAGPLDAAEACLNTFYNTGAVGAPSNNEPAFAFRVDCPVGNMSTSSASTTQGGPGTVSTSTLSTVLSSRPLVSGNSSLLSIPTECYASARPSDTARSLDTPRLVTYVSELEPITETITTTITLKDHNNNYAPYQYFTVTGPTTIFATITTELKPDRSALYDPYTTHAQDYCQGMCGACSIYFPYVDVLYWPATSMNTACLGNSTTVTSLASLHSREIHVREHSVAGAGQGSVVSNGFTFISPSAYLVFPDISAADYCGRRGSDYTSVTLAVAPKDLSSIVTGIRYSLDIADLLCPPKHTEPFIWQNAPVSFLGQGYRPIISPPPELLSLDPTWGGCYVDPFQGNDPPKALGPVAAMDPATTIVANIPSASPAIPSPAPPALPLSTNPADPAAKPSPTGNIQPVAASVPVSSPHPPYSADPPQPSASNDKGNPSQPAASGSNVEPQLLLDHTAPPAPVLMTAKIGDSQPTLPLPPDAQSQPQENKFSKMYTTKSGIIGGHEFTVVSGGSNIVIDSMTLAVGGPVATVSGTPVSLGTGGLVVMSHIQAPQGVPAQNPSQISAPVTIDGHVISIVDGTLKVDGVTITAGAPAVTISGKPVSLNSGQLVIGSHTYAIQTTSSGKYLDWSPLATVGNQVITAYPTGVAFSGTTLLPGGAGVTISGTPVSLDSSGLLIIGTSTQIIGSPATASVTGFSVDGLTLHPGQAGITVSGTPISLNPSGLLVVGGSTLPPGALATAFPTALSIEGTLLKPGGAALTVSGEVVSLQSSGLLVVGTRTISLDPSRSTDGAGLGGLILSGLGPIGGSAGPAATSVQAFTGAQARLSMPSIACLSIFSGVLMLAIAS